MRFVDLAETFHLPVVYLCDCPGFLIGLEAEKSATIRHGVRAMAAINQSTRAVVHGDRAQLVRRRRRRARAGGPAGACATPGCRRWWGSLPLEGGIEAAYRAEIEAAPDPKAKLAEIETRLNALRSPFRTAETFWVEEIIDPRDTRKLLCEFADLAEPLRTPGPRAFSMRP